MIKTPAQAANMVHSGGKGRGGKRPGAGRPKGAQGSKNLIIKTTAPEKGARQVAKGVTTKPARTPEGQVGRVITLDPTLPGLTPEEIRAIARKYGGDAIQFFAAVLMDVEQPMASRAYAANQILDRGIGKAAQPLHHGNANGEALVFEEMNTDKLDLALKRLELAVSGAEANSAARRDDEAEEDKGAKPGLH